MKTLVGITLIIILILLGQRWTFVRFKILYITGTEFLLFGFLLSDNFIGLLDESALRGLFPVIGLGLGWIGFLYGLQFEWRVVRRFPFDYFLASHTQALVTLLVVFIPAYWILNNAGIGTSPAILTAAILAATAACSTQTVLALMSRQARIRRQRLVKVLRYVSSVGDLPGLTLLGVAFSLQHHIPLFGADRFAPLQWFLLSLGLGVLFGLLFVHVVRYTRSEEELLVVLLGTVFFGAGTAAYVNLSPLFVNLVSGVVVVNIVGQPHRIVELIHHPERPIYLTFLVVAGATLDLTSWWALILAAGYLAVRLVGKLIGGYVGARIILRDERLSSYLGLGLNAQGGMAVAMIVSYQMVANSEVSQTIVTGVVLAIVLNELLSPPLLRWLLRSGEGR